MHVGERVTEIQRYRQGLTEPLWTLLIQLYLHFVFLFLHLFLLNNKMDMLRLWITSHRLNHCVMVITETWLDQHIPDIAIVLAGCAVYRADRTANTGKSRGRGLHIHVNNSWCTNTIVTKTLTALRTWSTSCYSADLSTCPGSLHW